MKIFTIATVFLLMLMGTACDAGPVPAAPKAPGTPTPAAKSATKAEPAAKTPAPKAQPKTKAAAKSAAKNSRPVPKAKYIPPPPDGIKGK